MRDGFLRSKSRSRSQLNCLVDGLDGSYFFRSTSKEK